MDIWNWYRDRNLGVREEAEWGQDLQNVVQGFADLNRSLFGMWAEQYPGNPLADWWKSFQ